MKRIIASVILLLILTGCTHYYYIPNAQNVPLFRDKNEFRVALSAGGGDETNFVGFHSAYAVTNHIGVAANYMYGYGGRKNDGNDWARGHYLDAALGYFQQIDKHGVFEVFAGVGSGNQHHEYQFSHSSFGGGSQPNTFGSADLPFTKYYIQPSIGITYFGFDLAVTSAFALLSFNEVKKNMDMSESEYRVLDAIDQNRTSLMFEPGITVRGGWQFLKGQIQLLGVINTSGKDLKFEKNESSISLYFAFAERYHWGKKKKKLVN
ncbi:MAG: hypothetical protein ABI378_00795 [Chitinophagaceae bacterium]